MTNEEMSNKGIKEAVALIRKVDKCVPKVRDEMVINFVLDFYLGTCVKATERYVTPTFAFLDNEPTGEDIKNFENDELLGFKKTKAL